MLKYNIFNRDLSPFCPVVQKHLLTVDFEWDLSETLKSSPGLVILSQILEINHWVAADAHSKVTKYV
jgi:hypothetical protein